MKKIFSLFLCLTLSMSAFAYDFYADGLYFNIINRATNEVEITSRPVGSYYGPTGDFVIPSTVQYQSVTYSVTRIEEYAFYASAYMTAVTIPNSVTYIGDFAFSYCTSLESITIGRGVRNIGISVAMGCTNLMSITVAADNWYYGSPNNCNAIIDLTTNELIQGCNTTVIPSSVTSIGSYAFSGYTGLTSISIPNSVTSIGDAAFEYCTGLTSISIPNSVTSIGSHAFIDCDNMTSVIIGRGVSSIANSTFYSCDNLSSVIIGENVTSIGEYAFDSCFNMANITCYANIPPTVSSTTFFDYNAVLHVPTNRINLYSSTPIWRNFRIQQISTEYYTIVARSNDAQMGATLGSGIYEENSVAQLIAIPNTGYYFRQWNDGNTDNPRNVVVTGDSSFIASFVPYSSLTYSITVNANDDQMGTTIGSGIYEENENVQIIAVPYAGYSFLYWNDGNTDNPRNILVTEDATYTAIFDDLSSDNSSADISDIYYFDGRVYNEQNIEIRLYYSDGKFVLMSSHDIDMSLLVSGIYIAVYGKGRYLKINHYMHK